MEDSQLLPEALLQAVQDVKAGGRAHATLKDAFVVAYRLMSVGSHTGAASRCVGEPEFLLAQAILLQIANGMVCGRIALSQTVFLDNARTIYLCRWGHRLLALPRYFEPMLTSHSEALEYRLFPRPDSTYYKDNIVVTSVTDGNHELLIEGPHIVISYVHPHIDLAGTSTSTAALQLLSHFIRQPSTEDIHNYMAAAIREQPVIFLKRNLGLSCPGRPFYESSNVVFLHDPDDVSQVISIADHIPCGLSRGCLDFQHGVVPFACPPALDDWDARMQNCMLALASPFADVEEAAEFFQQKLEEQSVDLAQVDVSFVDDMLVHDVDVVIENAKRLARDALACLRHHHVAVAWISGILEDTLASVFYEARIRREQGLISKRWDQPDRPKNKHAARREKKQCLSQGDDNRVVGQQIQEPILPRLQRVLKEFHHRVFKARHYQKAFNALDSAGLMRHISHEGVHGSHHVLHRPQASSVTVVRPHGNAVEHVRHRFVRSLKAIALSGC